MPVKADHERPSFTDWRGHMQKHPNLKPNSCGATARSAAPATSPSGSLPSSFEDWLHDDAQTPDLEAWSEEAPTPLQVSDPTANRGLESDPTRPNLP